MPAVAGGPLALRAQQSVPCRASSGRRARAGRCRRVRSPEPATGRILQRLVKSSSDWPNPPVPREPPGRQKEGPAPPKRVARRPAGRRAQSDLTGRGADLTGWTADLTRTTPLAARWRRRARRSNWVTV